MNVFRRRQRASAQANRRKVAGRTMLLEKLEVREVPAIAIVEAQVRVTGSSLDDAVAISFGPRGSGQLVVTQTETGVGGQSTETKSFPFSLVASIRVSLGNGTNQFTNITSIPSMVFGGTGADILTGGTGNDTLSGFGGNDLIKGGGGNDSLDGSSGQDVIEGGDGNDTINGGDGDDILRGDAGNDSVRGGSGNDTMQGGDGLDQMRGDGGSDRLLGGAGNDSLYGDADNDILEGDSGDDILYGGLGNDKLVGGSENDRLYGDAGADALFGGTGNDKAYGGDGVDELFGNSGNDELHGDAGGDTIEGGSGADKIFGGSDKDMLYGNAKASKEDTVDGNNTINGGDGDDEIYSSAGNDIIKGEAGKDLIKAGAGDDRIWGGLDNDRVFAGDGNDEAYGDSGNDVVHGGKGLDRVEGGSGDDLLAANIVYADIEDTVVSGDSEDTAGNKLFGGSGNDRLYGGSMADVLSGDDGNDWLNGAAGNDELYGAAGKDVLLGGSGEDKLDGGLDVDRIVAIDTAIDQIIPQPPTAITVERDELWIDSNDRWGNLLAVSKVQSAFPEAVHVVSQYRAYDAFSFLQVRPPMVWGVDDLIDPDAREQHQGSSSFSKSNYGDSPLFGPGGPVWNDVDQGAVGTCYFLSRLAALAKTHPQHIRDMITELGDGTFVVQFLNQEGTRTFVRVDGELYRDGSILYADRGTGDSMWVAIVEKAWAIHRFGYATYDSISGGNGVQSDDRTDTSMALAIWDVRLTQNIFGTPQLFANTLKILLDAGKGVVFGARSFIDDNMPKIVENRRRSEHILMVHSVDADVNGNVTKIRYYDLYGGPLKEMSNLGVFFYGCGGITAFEPIA